MSETDPRFEVPPEYADVYEQAFRRASNAEPLDVPDSLGPLAAPRTAGPRAWRRSAGGLGLTVAGLGLLALVAFTLGRSSVPSETGSISLSAFPGAVDGALAGPSAPLSASSAARAVQPVGATSTCEPPVVTGADGAAVSFAPSNVLDGDDATDWACAGMAVGEKLVITLPSASRISRVGLLQTRQVGGVAPNQIQEVEWGFDDQTTVRQRLTGTGVPGALLQSVPPTTTGTITLRIVAVRSGPADLTGISSVFLSGPSR